MKKKNASEKLSEIYDHNSCWICSLQWL